jgi:hypothetical protein
VSRLTEDGVAALHLTRQAFQAILPAKASKGSKIMKFAYFSLGAILAALVFGASVSGSASAATDLHASAVHACTTANSSQPVEFVAAVDDGRGGSLVWLTDADANLWLCNADVEGHIFAYSKMIGDLLQGAGANLVDIEPAVNEGEVTVPEKNPLAIAESACQAYLSDGPGKVVGSGLDGLDGDWVPGYFVFIDTGNGLVLCDATADAQVWAFAEIGDPLGSPVG